MLTSKNLLPFMGVEFDQTVEFDNGKKFRVITYQAYNAYGRIGPEKNGIAILNENERNVVLDEHLKQSTGYFGASKQIIAEAQKIANLPWNQFQAFVNNNNRSRYTI